MVVLAGRATVCRPLPVDGTGTGPMASLSVTALLPSSAMLPVSINTSVLAMDGVLLTEILTGIRVDELVVKGAEFEVDEAVSTCAVADPAERAGTTAAI